MTQNFAPKPVVTDWNRVASDALRPRFKLTPTMRRYLEQAVNERDGELRAPAWESRAGGSIWRMYDRLKIAGLIEFKPKRMGYFVTEECRRLLADLPPVKRRPSYRAGGPVRSEQF